MVRVCAILAARGVGSWAGDLHYGLFNVGIKVANQKDLVVIRSVGHQSSWNDWSHTQKYYYFFPSSYIPEVEDLRSLIDMIGPIAFWHPPQISIDLHVPQKSLGKGVDAIARAKEI